MNGRMKVTVQAAEKSEKDIINNLLQYYLHDFSEFEALESDAQGRYHYPYLEHYWNDPNRHPFLFRLDKRIVGFAMVRSETDPGNGRHLSELAEFFVLRVFRNQGIGNRAAVRLWDLFPGQWLVRVLRPNKIAYPFWKNAINRYTAGQYVEQSGGEIEFCFKAPGYPS